MLISWPYAVVATGVITVVAIVAACVGEDPDVAPVSDGGGSTPALPDANGDAIATDSDANVPPTCIPIERGSHVSGDVDTSNAIVGLAGRAIAWDACRRRWLVVTNIITAGGAGFAGALAYHP